MDDITPPEPESTERLFDCKQAIEARVRNLVEDACSAGWEHGEVLVAISEIADYMAMMLLEREALVEALYSLKSNKPSDN